MTLMVVMILGLITIVALFVMRFAQLPGGAVPLLPTAITLPEGTEPLAVTRAPDWVAVVTTDNRILIFAPDGTAIQEVEITR